MPWNIRRSYRAGGRRHTDGWQFGRFDPALPWGWPIDGVDPGPSATEPLRGVRNRFVRRLGVYWDSGGQANGCGLIFLSESSTPQPALTQWNARNRRYRLERDLDATAGRFDQSRRDRPLKLQSTTIVDGPDHFAVVFVTFPTQEAGCARRGRGRGVQARAVFRQVAELPLTISSGHGKSRRTIDEIPPGYTTFGLYVGSSDVEEGQAMLPESPSLSPVS